LLPGLKVAPNGFILFTLPTKRFIIQSDLLYFFLFSPLCTLVDVLLRACNNGIFSSFNSFGRTFSFTTKKQNKKELRVGRAWPKVKKWPSTLFAGGQKWKIKTCTRLA